MTQPASAIPTAAHAGGVHVDLDGGATEAAGALGLATLDALAWGPRLRCTTTSALVERFHAELRPRLAPFTLFGSGDFHHLSGVWLRAHEGPITLVSFDNHPDWDIRPPRWGCGGWLKRALDSSRVEAAHVWGCGNFELAWPGRVFRLRSDRLSVWPWAERLRAPDRRRYRCIERATWRASFETFCQSLRGKRLYVTIDMDCLDASSAITNWEQGLFALDDLVWALDRLRGFATLVGGDLCGARTGGQYARWTQRFAAAWDHPELPGIDDAAAQRLNLSAMTRLWPALTAS